ncbi:uncharacterized protein TNCV_3865551 [Trichonephila clavipes]|nr:uncharacterized protein TNCV_3865551 [Trichonephila clavipes]
MEKSLKNLILKNLKLISKKTLRSAHFQDLEWAAVAEWYRYRTVACFVTGSSPVPLKTRHVGQRCTLNLSRAETSSRWCGVVVRRGGASSGVVHVTCPWFKITWSVAKSPRVAEQCDVNIQSINQSGPRIIMCQVSYFWVA